MGGTAYAEIKKTELAYVFSGRWYRAPRFLVSVSGSKDQIVGSRLRATVEGRYLFGAPVSGAPVEWSSWASRRNTPRRTVTITATGETGAGG